MVENNGSTTPTTTPVRCLEGARVLVQVTVYEDVKAGAILRDDGPFKVQTRADGNERFISVNLVYPFPEGLIDDPITGKEAKDLTPNQLARAVENWGKAIEELKKTKTTGPVQGISYGRVITANAAGTDVDGLVPLDSIPTPSEIFLKGFKLEIQGPVNQQMRKAQLIVKGQRASVTKAAKNLTNIG